MDWTTGITATWITSLGRFLATATRPAASQPASFLDLAGKKTAVACPVGARPSRATTRCRAPFARPRARQRRPASARRGAFTRAAPGRARLVQSLRDGGMDPTIRQIIFSRIIMLARKVATDMCLLSQSLPRIFMCTICSGAFASHRLQWKPDNARGKAG